MLIASNGSSQMAAKAEARQYLKKALALNPKLADARLQLGILAQNAGDLDSAIASRSRAVECAPNRPQHITGSGLVL